MKKQYFLAGLLTMVMLPSLILGQQWDGADNTTDPIYRTGNVGIGETDPDAKLHLDGDFYIERGHEINFYTDGYGLRAGIAATYSAPYNELQFFVSGHVEAVRVDNSGNVGIGTTAPQSKLAVNGTITAKEVEVTLTGWPDFVFEEHYDLRPLDDVEKYIKENHHLPNMPSADEVEENGVGLGEMQAKLLEKVEELTLYVIDLKNENEALKGRVASLEEEQ